MVCVPCLFIPAGLFIWYRFLQPVFLRFVYPVLAPIIAKFWDPYVQPMITRVSSIFKDPNHKNDTSSPTSNGVNPHTQSSSNGTLSGGEEKRKCPIASLSGKSSTKID